MACWGINGNGVADLATEVQNADHVMNVLDSTGSQGPQGLTGAMGATGATGAQGPSGIVASSFVSGFGSSPTATLQFLAYPATVTVVAGQPVYVNSSKVLVSGGPGSTAAKPWKRAPLSRTS